MIEIKTGVIRPVECMKEGWEVIKQDYWLFFAITLVGLLIGGASLYILVGAMISGIFYCYLQKIDGNPVLFDGLWKGFQWWVPGLIATIVIMVPMIIVYGLIYIPFIAAAVMGSKLSQEEMLGLLFGAFAVDFFFIIFMVCFHTLLMFTFPLIVDRNLGVFDAMKTSAKAVWKNLGGIAGLYGVAFVLSLAGALACGVGTYFVIPIIMAGTTVAYRKIFPKPNEFHQPPPPNFYQGIQG
jgi:hypothetical protein